MQATLHEDRLFVAGFGTIGAALSPHDEARLRGLLLARAARVFRALDEFFASTVPKGWLPDSASGLKVSELRFNPRGGDGFLLPTNLEAQAFLLPKPGARRSGAHVIWTDKGAVLGMSGFGLSSSGPSQVVGPHQARIEFSRLYGPAAGPAILADLATIGPRVNALGRALLATLS